MAAPGDYGKLRPAVIVQADALHHADTVLVCLITSHLADEPLYRLTLEPSARNQLRKPSQVMMDKIIMISRAKCGAVIGKCTKMEMTILGEGLITVLGLAD